MRRFRLVTGKKIVLNLHCCKRSAMLVGVSGL